MATPLADRIRPQTIDEMVGQQHLIGDPFDSPKIRYWKYFFNPHEDFVIVDDDIISCKHVLIGFENLFESFIRLFNEDVVDFTS